MKDYRKKVKVQTPNLDDLASRGVDFAWTYWLVLASTYFVALLVATETYDFDPFSNVFKCVSVLCPVSNSFADRLHNESK